MKKIIIITFLMFLFSFEALLSQNIKSSLYINAKSQPYFSELKKDTTAKYGPLCPYLNLIKQEIDISNLKKDTLILILKYPGVFADALSPLYYHNLDIKAITKKNKKIKIDFSFDTKKLTIPIKKNLKSLIITYDYQSDFMFRSAPSEDFQPHIGYWHSCFFTTDSMQIDEVEFNKLDSIHFFANLPTTYNDKTITLNTDKIKQDISFYYLTKKSYNTKSINIENIEVNLYLLNDTVDREKRYSLIENNVKKAINGISKIFSSPFKKHQINIAESTLRLYDGTSKWGSTSNITDSSFVIFIDSSFWNTNDFIHEMLHTFDKAMDFTKDDDSTRYFFRESLIEYLSIYLYYDDAIDKQSIYNKNMLNYFKYETPELLSIFKVDENLINFLTGVGTSDIIYNRTPYIINCFAQQIGEDNFILAIKEFYALAHSKKNFSLEDLETIVKKHGATDKQWKDFIKAL